MKKLITLLLLLMPTGVVAQQIAVSPGSTMLWGQSPSTVRASISHGNFEAVYLMTKQTYRYMQGVYTGGFAALFWNPLKLNAGKFDLVGGAGVFMRRFPTTRGSTVNFQAKVTYSLTKKFGVQYSHCSNGFGIQNEYNPGIDNLSLVVNF